MLRNLSKALHVRTKETIITDRVEYRIPAIGGDITLSAVRTEDHTGHRTTLGFVGDCATN